LSKWLPRLPWLLHHLTCTCAVKLSKLVIRLLASFTVYDDIQNHKYQQIKDFKDRDRWAICGSDLRLLIPVKIIYVVITASIEFGLATAEPRDGCQELKYENCDWVEIVEARYAKIATEYCVNEVLRPEDDHNK